MLKRIQVLEDGRTLAMEARSWKIEGQKRRITIKEYQRLLNKFEMEGFMAQKGLWNLVREKVLQDRRALPEEGERSDAIGEYKQGYASRKFPELLVEGRWERQGRNHNGNRNGDQKKKWAKRGGEKRRKKRTKRRESK